MRSRLRKMEIELDMGLFYGRDGCILYLDGIDEKGSRRIDGVEYGLNGTPAGEGDIFVFARVGQEEGVLQAAVAEHVSRSVGGLAQG